MKTTIKTSAPNSLEAVMIKPQSRSLAFGAGYLHYLTTTAMYDEEEPARTGLQQPVRYLAAVEPMLDAGSSQWEQIGISMRRTLGDGLKAAISSAARPAEQVPSLRDAVIALRQRILAS